MISIMMDELIPRVEDELRDLAKEDVSLSSQEEDIRRRRNDIRNRVVYLTGGLEFYREMMGLEKSHKPEGSPSQYISVPRPLSTYTVADLAAEILQERGGAAKVRDITDELIRRGKLKGVRSDYGTVFGTLSRNSVRFRQIGKGEFTLAIPRELASEPQQPS